MSRRPPRFPPDRLAIERAHDGPLPAALRAIRRHGSADAAARAARQARVRDLDRACAAAQRAVAITRATLSATRAGRDGGLARRTVALAGARRAALAAASLELPPALR